LVGQALQQLDEPVSCAVIISNRDIDRHYGDTVRASLDDCGLFHSTLLIPAGERYKSLETASRLYGDFIQRKIDRKSVVIALGGGVIGDLAGFVAATYERGIRFIQLPTTLLAQVDSSVGGKVGVNHSLGKNMIGAFLQPQTVLIDPKALRTLPKREIRSGLAEIIKYGVIWDEDFFGYLEHNVDSIVRLDAQTMRHLIRRSCQIKAHVVEEDERESGLRAILNFGHTMLRQSGVIRARSLRDLLDFARGVPMLPTPKGENVVIITGAGGSGVLLSDACVDNGLKLLKPMPADLDAAFRKFIPPFGAAGNPVDITGGEPPITYMNTVRLGLEDERIHALILGYWHTIVTPPMVFARNMVQVVDEMRAKGIVKPIVASLAGDVEVEEAAQYLYEHGIPAYAYSTEIPVAVLGAKYQWARGAGLL
jgi:hypothetical protein